jgi:hypothetical protein
MRGRGEVFLTNVAMALTIILFFAQQKSANYLSSKGQNEFMSQYIAGLIEAGFEYVCEMGYVKLFRKRR